MTTVWPSAASVGARMIASEERLRPGEVAEERDRDDEARDDRQRQADSEQAHRDAERPSQRLQVDARGVGEQDDGERRLGEGLDLGAGRGGVDEVERLDADDEPCGGEDHRCGDPRSLDAGRDGREAEEDDGENRELPVHGGSFSEAGNSGPRGTVPRCRSGMPTSRSTRRSCARF